MAANLAALLQILELREAGRPATAQEQQVLARWGGWGAFGQLFDTDEFPAEHAILRERLSEQEYAAARRSTINAHYTDAALVTPIWTALRELGFDGGDVLEPGCGPGHFIGLAPPEARMSGVELEPISAAIAAALYPDATITTGSFADAATPENTFDAAIGNVPFAKVKLQDPRHNPGRAHSIHNHFILKALRLTRPGGMVALLTSRYTMDAQNPGARAEMAQLADLVGAVRLPSNAHQRAAGTHVVTDLLILRRRDPDTDPVVDFGTWDLALPTPLGEDGAEAPLINRYFRDHPEHVLGEFALDRGQFDAQDLIVRGDLDQLPEQFAAALTGIVEHAKTRGLAFGPRPETSAGPATGVILADPDAARFDGFITAHPDGSFTRQIMGEARPFAPPATQADELRALIGLRDTAMALIQAEGATADGDQALEQLRAQLNASYDDYVAEYGFINRCTVRRAMRQGWHVFGEWCANNGYDKVPANRAAVVTYLEQLRDSGVGQDLLGKHLDSIDRNHQATFERHAKKAARTIVEELVRKGEVDRADTETTIQRALERNSPAALLKHAKMPDPRLDPQVLAAGRAVVATAPETTPAELDLDELGLRTTQIDRPPQGGFRSDPFHTRATFLERYTPGAATAAKADILTRRQVNRDAPRLGADTPEEALSICMDTHTRVDLAEIARLLGLPEPQQARQALGRLVFDDPETGELVWAPLYLSGNVRTKLALAQAAAEDNPAFAANVEALQQVVPEDLGPRDIEVRLGSWIGPDVVQQFLRELLSDEHITVEYAVGIWLVQEHKGKWSPKTRLAAETVWSGGGLNAIELTEALLDGTPIRVYDELKDGGRVFNPEKTEQATDKADELNQRFADWVWEDATRARTVMRAYNDAFNSEIPPDFAGVEMALPGLSQHFTLQEHQKIAVARIIHQPGFGIVHEVGAGKTLEVIVGLMESRRRGLITKPCVVVPNDSIAASFHEHWMLAYPNANILIGTSDKLADDKKKGKNGRLDFVAQVAANEFDAIIMTKESFQRIPAPPEAEERFLRAELDDLQNELESKGDTLSKSMTKKIETAVANAAAALEARLDAIDRDVAGMTLADAGIDKLAIDEAQNYKNGFILSRIPDLVIPGAARSIDLDVKLVWLQETYGTARVILASATPWTGKFSELYLWQRRLGQQLPRFDEHARTFVVSEQYLEYTPGGTMRAKTRTRKPINQTELWRAIQVLSDIRMREDLNLPVPDLRGGETEIIEVPAPPEARVLTLDFARRERRLRGLGWRPSKGEDNHLTIQHDARLASLDLRTVGVRTRAPQKVHALADDIVKEWTATRDRVYHRPDGAEHPVRGGVIMVFCDLSVPDARRWNFYTELRTQLAARGMPEQGIRFIQEGASSPQKKADILQLAREGGVSVLVGSTMMMGAGINAQTRAVGGYLVTLSWRADIVTQAKGRIERQGNQNPEVFWKAVLLSPSQDAKMAEISAQKGGMFAPFYSNTPPARTREIVYDDVETLTEMMATATGDPRYVRKAELDKEVKALRRRASTHNRIRQDLRFTILTETERIPRLQQQAEKQERIAAALPDLSGDHFTMTVDGRTFTKRTDAAEALRSVLTARHAAVKATQERSRITIGTIGELEVHAHFSPRDSSIDVTLGAELGSQYWYSVNGGDLPGGIGLVTRLENLLKHIVGAADVSRNAIRDAREVIAHAETEVAKPFPEAELLAQLEEERDALIAELMPQEAARPDADEDPNSPEAIARRERHEALQRQYEAVFSRSEDAARAAGLDEDSAEVFLSWYQAIGEGLPPDSYPPPDVALRVWEDIGRPDSHERVKLRALGPGEERIEHDVAELLGDTDDARYRDGTADDDLDLGLDDDEPATSAAVDRATAAPATPAEPEKDFRESGYTTRARVAAADELAALRAQLIKLSESHQVPDTAIDVFANAELLHRIAEAAVEAVDDRIMLPGPDRGTAVPVDDSPASVLGEFAVSCLSGQQRGPLIWHALRIDFLLDDDALFATIAPATAPEVASPEEAVKIPLEQEWATDPDQHHEIADAIAKTVNSAPDRSAARRRRVRRLLSQPSRNDTRARTTPAPTREPQTPDRATAPGAADSPRESPPAPRVQPPEAAPAPSNPSDGEPPAPPTPLTPAHAAAALASESQPEHGQDTPAAVPAELEERLRAARREMKAALNEVGFELRRSDGRTPPGINRGWRTVTSDSALPLTDEMTELADLVDEVRMEVELAAAGYARLERPAAADARVDHAQRIVTTDSTLSRSEQLAALGQMVTDVRARRQQLLRAAHERQIAASAAGEVDEATAEHARELLSKAGRLDALAARVARASRDEHDVIIPREGGVMARLLNSSDRPSTLLGFARAAQQGRQPADVLHGDFVPANYLTWRGTKIWFDRGVDGVQLNVIALDIDTLGMETLPVPEAVLAAGDGDALVTMLRDAYDTAAGRADAARQQVLEILTGSSQPSTGPSAPVAVARADAAPEPGAAPDGERAAAATVETVRRSLPELLRAWGEQNGHHIEISSETSAGGTRLVYRVDGESLQPHHLREVIDTGKLTWPSQPDDVDAHAPAAGEAAAPDAQDQVDAQRRSDQTTTSLRELRALAEQFDLETRVVRVGEKAFVTVYHPDVPTPPVLSWPAGEPDVFDGAGRPLPATLARDYLATYRNYVPVTLLADPGVADWPRRIAQLAPHMIPGSLEGHQAIRDHITAAAARAADDRAAAEQELREAEAIAGPLTLTPERRAQVVRMIEDFASGYAFDRRDVGRYLVAPGHLDGSHAEWEWINAYVQANPAVLDGSPDHKGIQERNLADHAAGVRQAEEFSRQAAAAFKAGATDRALALLDQAELADPTMMWRWESIRHRVRGDVAAPASNSGAGADAADASAEVPAEASAAWDEAGERASTPEERTRALHARINAAAAVWFSEQLDGAPAAQEYLIERLGSAAAVERVRARLSIGYAPTTRTGLVTHLQKQGFAGVDLVSAGVAREDPHGRCVDVFTQRIMFAYRDLEGRVAGFVGRDIRPGDPRVKYLNTKTTPLFDKGKLLLGLHEQRELLRTGDPLVVEGPLDQAAHIAAAAAGTDTVALAACGSAVTSAHLDAIDALVPVDRRRVFGLDPDAGGTRGILPRGPEAAARYPNVEITILPSGLDPAEYALAAGGQALIEAYRGAPFTRPALDVLIELRLRTWTDRLAFVEGQTGAARDIAALLAGVDLRRVADIALREAGKLGLDPEHMADAVLTQWSAHHPSTHRRTDSAVDEVAALLAIVDRDRVGELAVRAAAMLERSPELLADRIAQARNARLAEHARPEPALDPAAEPPRSGEPATGSATDAVPPSVTSVDASAAGTTAAEPAEGAPPEQWTRQIQITVTADSAIVTGTRGRGRDPQILPKTLKANGFEWSRDQNHWHYVDRRKRTTRDDAVTAIRAMLSELDKSETRPAPATFPPTPQQQAAIDAATRGQDIAMLALAGAGKTTVLRMIAEHLPDKKILYIAFNKSIADEAKQSFGRNVTARTFHSLARAGLANDPRYAEKFKKIAKGDGFPEQIARTLGRNPDDDITYGPYTPDDPGYSTVAWLVRDALAAVTAYRQSSDRELGDRHLRLGDSASRQKKAVVLEIAREIWADKVHPKGQLAWVHDDYRKIWALGDPRIDADVILFDEAQDINELQAHLVQAQDAQKIVVGDTYQHIYGFTGARDYLTDWPADVVLPLTQSWRFGPEVAETGNKFLRLLDAPLELEGNPAITSVIGEIEAPDAILCRTNAGTVVNVIKGIEAGLRVALVGGGDDIKAIAKAARNLMQGRRTTHEDLSIFASWTKVCDYVRDHPEETTLATLVSLVNEHGPDGLIEMADELVDEALTGEFGPQLTVSTAHKAKGREWPKVRIGGDFRGPSVDQVTGDLVLPDRDSLHLSYVAVTRARQQLDPGSLSWILTFGQPALQPGATVATPELTAAPNTSAEAAPPPPATVTASAEPKPVAEPPAAPARAMAVPDGAGIDDIHDRESLIRYILAGSRNKHIRDLVSHVLSGRFRGDVAPQRAADELAALDVDIHRRVITAAVGRGKRGEGWDFGRVQAALRRLAEGDVTLPIASVGQYVELSIMEDQPPDADGWTPVPKGREPVRGIVAEILPQHGKTVRVVIDRDVISPTGAPRAVDTCPLDATLTVLPLSERPSAAERDAANLARQPQINAHRAAIGALAPSPADAADPERADPEPAGADSVTAPQDADDQPVTPGPAEEITMDSPLAGPLPPLELTEAELLAGLQFYQVTDVEQLRLKRLDDRFSFHLGITVEDRADHWWLSGDERGTHGFQERAVPKSWWFDEAHGDFYPPKDAQRLRAAWLEKAREAAALGFHLATKQTFTPGRDGLPLNTIALLGRTPLPDRLEQAARRIAGAGIPATQDLSDHPVVAHVRDTVARAQAATWEGKPPSWVRTAAAVEAICDYLPVPARLVDLALALTRDGDIAAAMPRELDLETPHDWPHWAGAVRQTARILDHTGPALAPLADRLRAAGGLLEDRVGALGERSAMTQSRTGLVSIPLLPADHPDALPLLTEVTVAASQFSRALDSHALGAGSPALLALKAILTGQAATPADEKRVIGQEARLHAAEIGQDFAELAPRLRELGYTQPVGAPPLGLPEFLQQLADQLLTEHGRPTGNRSFGAVPGSVLTPLQRLQRRADADRAYADELATGIRTSLTEIREEADSTFARATDPQPYDGRQRAPFQAALDAVAVGNVGNARRHLATALTIGPLYSVSMGGRTARSILQRVLRRDIYGDQIPDNAWIIRAQLTSDKPTFGPESVAVNLSAWAEYLRTRSGRPGDEVGELLARIRIGDVAAELDAIAAGLAHRHGFALPQARTSPSAEADLTLFDTAPVTDAATVEPPQPSPPAATVQHADLATAEPTESAAGSSFPMQLSPADLVNRDTLLHRISSTLHAMPAEIDGTATGPVQLALAVIGSTVARGKAFLPRTIALRVTGNYAAPEVIAERIRQFADLLDASLPEPDQQREVFGVYPQERVLSEHLYAIGGEIADIAATPAELTRSRAATWFGTLTEADVRSLLGALAENDQPYLDAYFGPQSPRGHLIDPAALGLLRDVVTARTRNDSAAPLPPEPDSAAGQAETAITTALQVHALAAEARLRMQHPDRVGVLLQQAGWNAVADQLESAAAAMAAAGDFALPGPAVDDPPDTPEPQQQEDAVADAAADRSGKLVPYDVAAVLRTMRAADVAMLLRQAGQPHPSPYPTRGHWERTRAAHEPDAGVSERVRYTLKALQLEITAEAPRYGRLPWGELQRWLEPGITPARLRILLDAADTHEQLVARAGSFLAIDGQDLAEGLRAELGRYRDEARAELVDAALATHEAERGRRRRRGRHPVTMLPIEQLTDLTDLTDRQRQLLDRIAAIRALIPAESVPTPLTQLKATDVVEHAAREFQPLRLTRDPVIDAEQVTLVGELLPPETGAATEWQIATTAPQDVLVLLIPKAGSASSLAVPPVDQPVEAAVQERLDIPEDVVPDAFDWTRTRLRPDRDVLTEYWVRDDTELVLTWVSTPDTLLLANPIRVGDSEHLLSSADELPTVLTEAGTVGYGRPDGTGGWAVTPAATVAAARAAVAENPSLQLLSRTPTTGWNVADTADPSVRHDSADPTRAPVGSGTLASSEGQFSLWDLAADDPRPATPRDEATGVAAAAPVPGSGDAAAGAASDPGPASGDVAPEPAPTTTAPQLSGQAAAEPEAAAAEDFSADAGEQDERADGDMDSDVDDDWAAELEDDFGAEFDPTPLATAAAGEPTGAARPAQGGLFDVDDDIGRSAKAAADRPERGKYAPPGSPSVFPAEQPGHDEPHTEAFTHALDVAMAATIATMARGGHDPDSWFGLADLVFTHPDAPARRPGQATSLHDPGSEWWLVQAARAFRDRHGFTLEVRAPARGAKRRPRDIEVDRSAQRVVLDGSQPIGTLAFNAMSCLAEFSVATDRDTNLHHTSPARAPVAVTDEQVNQWLRLRPQPADPEHGGVFTHPDLFTQAHALAREAAALGYRLGAPAETDAALPLSTRELKGALAEARIRLDGLAIPLTSDLHGHPVVDHIRTAIADTAGAQRTKASSIEGAQRRAMAAAMAVSDYLRLPEDTDLVALVEQMAPLRGPHEAVMPRWLDYLPVGLLPEFAETLRHAGRAIDTAEPELMWLTARLRGVADVLDARAARWPDQLAATAAMRVGLAAITLRPADRPGMPLHVQLERADRHPLATGFMITSAQRALVRTLTDPAATPEKQAERILHDGELSNRDRFLFGQAIGAFAHIADEAGYREPLGDPPLPVPDYLRQVADALTPRPALPARVEHEHLLLGAAVPWVNWSAEPPAARLQRRLADSAVEATRQAKEAKEALIRVRGDADLILHAMSNPGSEAGGLVSQAIADADTGDLAAARAAVADSVWAATDEARWAPDAELVKGVLTQFLLRGIRSDQATDPEWLARAIEPGTSSLGSAQNTAAGLAAWAWSLRRAARDTDSLGRLLARIGIDDVAAALDAVAAGLARRHGFAPVPDPKPGKPRPDGPLVLADGRELSKTTDPSHLPPALRGRLPGDVYLLLVPGRARLVVAAPAPEVAGRSPWAWAVQQLNAADFPVGVDRVHGVTYTDPGTAARNGAKAFDQLLAALEKGPPEELALLNSHWAALTFVPKWGNFREQLLAQKLPAALQHRTARLALQALTELGRERQTVEDVARWLLTGGDGAPLTVLETDEVLGHVEDLAALARVYGRHRVTDLMHVGGGRKVSSTLKQLHTALRARRLQPIDAPETPAASATDERDLGPAPHPDAAEDSPPGDDQPHEAPVPAGQAPTVAAADPAAPAVTPDGPHQDVPAAGRAPQLPDGRELEPTSPPLADPDTVRTFELAEPGRFRLILTATPCDDPTADRVTDWTWRLQHIDRSGRAAGPALREPWTFDSSEQALAAAESALTALETFLDTADPRAADTVTGPFADVHFVPGWGSAIQQLHRQEFPPQIAQAFPRIAIMVAQGLNTPAPDHVEAAAWVLRGRDGKHRDLGQVRELIGYLGDLEQRIHDSGVSDELPRAYDHESLCELLRLTRSDLAIALGLAPDDLTPIPQHELLPWRAGLFADVGLPEDFWPPLPQTDAPMPAGPATAASTVEVVPAPPPAPQQSAPAAAPEPPQATAAAAPSTHDPSTTSAVPSPRRAAAAPNPRPAEDDPTPLRDVFAQEWATLLEHAAELGFTVQTRYAGGSEVDTRAGVICISFDQPPASRVVDLALHLVQAATAATPINTRPAPAAARQQPVPEFPAHTGTLDLPAPAHSPGRGRFTGQLDLTALATADPPDGQASISFDQITREPGAATATPHTRAARPTPAPRWDRPHLTGVAATPHPGTRSGPNR